MQPSKCLSMEVYRTGTMQRRGDRKNWAIGCNRGNRVSDSRVTTTPPLASVHTVQYILFYLLGARAPRVLGRSGAGPVASGHPEARRTRRLVGGGTRLPERRARRDEIAPDAPSVEGSDGGLHALTLHASGGGVGTTVIPPFRFICRDEALLYLESCPRQALSRIPTREVAASLARDDAARHERKGYTVFLAARAFVTSATKGHWQRHGHVRQGVRAW